MRVPNLYMGNVLHCNFNLFRQFFVEPISSKVSHNGRMTTIGKFITKIARVRQTEFHPEDKFETVNLFIQTHKKKLNGAKVDKVIRARSILWPQKKNLFSEFY